MSTFTSRGTALAFAALLLGTVAVGGPAVAAPVAGANGAVVSDRAQSNVQDVRYRGWRGGGVGIYIGPGYGYYPSYGYGGGYYPRYAYGGYYPRYGYGSYSRYNYYDDYGYRPYRRNNRWVRERFEHPLGRR